MDEKDTITKEALLEMTADIVTAYVSHNTLEPKALPALIHSVYESMAELGNEPDSTVEPLIPAVDPENSVTDDYIICLEDGQKYKSLKRHLRTKFELTPKAYREKWGLPSDYPMVAKNYSKERSRLAKRTGLGKS